MEVPYSQLGAGADAVDEDATQPLPGGEDGASQPLPADGKPRALFSCQYGTQHGAAPTFSLDVRHGNKVFLGRPDRRPGAPARSLAAPLIALTTSADHGISRDNGWIEFDRHRGVVLVPIGRAGMPVFHNGELVGSTGAGVILSDGDVIGFGGASGVSISATTVRYRCSLTDMPALEPEMPPPPPPARTAAAPAAAEPAGAAATKRRRGETSSAARKRRRDEAAPAAAGDAAPPPAPQTLAGLAAQSNLAREHAALVSTLDHEPRRWARRALSCVSESYGLVQDAAREAADAGDGDVGGIHAAIKRVLHKVQALAGDSEREVQRARNEARTSAAQHARRDQAAQRRNDRRGSGGGNRGGPGNSRARAGAGEGAGVGPAEGAPAGGGDRLGVRGCILTDCMLRTTSTSARGAPICDRLVAAQVGPNRSLKAGAGSMDGWVRAGRANPACVRAGWAVLCLRTRRAEVPPDACVGSPWCSPPSLCSPDPALSPISADARKPCKTRCTGCVVARRASTERLSNSGMVTINVVEVTRSGRSDPARHGMWRGGDACLRASHEWCLRPHPLSSVRSCSR